LLFVCTNLAMLDPSQVTRQAAIPKQSIEQPDATPTATQTPTSPSTVATAVKPVVRISFAKKKQKTAKPALTLDDVEDRVADEEREKRMREVEARHREGRLLVIPLVNVNQQQPASMNNTNKPSLNADALSDADREAMEALTRTNTTTGSNDSEHELIIPNETKPQPLLASRLETSNLDDSQKLAHDLHRRPDELDPASNAYVSIPVGEFGSALLRGMGWKGEEAKEDGDDSAPKRRHHRLGLGALPRPVRTGTTTNGRKRIRRVGDTRHLEELENQKLWKARLEAAALRQRTVSVGSVVRIKSNGRRAVMKQTGGVPGLNLVLVAFEEEEGDHKVKRGDVELVTSEELERNPFRPFEGNTNEGNDNDSRAVNEKAGVKDDPPKPCNDQRDRQRRNGTNNSDGNQRPHHGRRYQTSRSRSPNSRSRSRSADNHNRNNRHNDGDRKRDYDRHKHRNNRNREEDRNMNRELDSNRNQTKDNDRNYESDRRKNRDRDRHGDKDRNRDRDRNKDQDGYRDRDRNKDKNRDRDHERDRDRGGRNRDRDRNQRQDRNRDRDRDTYRKDNHDTKRNDHDRQPKSPHATKTPQHWLVPHIRVRIISRKIPNATQNYRQTATVMDIAHRGTATLRVDHSGQVLERIPERYLETALPQQSSGSAYVLLLRGEHCGGQGRMLERNIDRNVGVVQLLEDMAVVTVSLDDIAEWCGDVD